MGKKNDNGFWRQVAIQVVAGIVGAILVSVVLAIGKAVLFPETAEPTP